MNLSNNEYFTTDNSETSALLDGLLYGSEAKSKKTAVFDYLGAGFRVIPLFDRSKEPQWKNWPNRVLTRNEVSEIWIMPANIGVVLGEASGGIVDIDVDHPDALKLAPYLLPATNFKFGRQSRPESHFVYRCPEPGKPRKFTHPDLGSIIEYRADGQQTMFPASRHPSGEVVEFFPPDPAPLPHIAEGTREEVLRAITLVAIGAVLLPYWRAGVRHQIALGVAGFLAGRGWTKAEVHKLVNAVAITAADEDLDDRLGCVRSTFGRIGTSETITGVGSLAEIMDQRTLDLFKKWAGPSLGVAVDDSKALSHVAEDADHGVSAFDLLAEDDAAEAFSQAHRDRVVYCSNTEQWFARSNQVYGRVAHSDMQGFVSEFVQPICDAAKGSISESLNRAVKSRSRINALIELSRPRLTVHASDLDADGDLLGLRDGAIIDLRTGGETNAPKAIITNRLGCSLARSAQCPEWLRFLHRIFEGDEDVVSFVQRAVGYSLSGETGEQCLFVLIGTGANGKSTFMNVLQNLLGDYAGTIPMQTLMVTRYGNEQTNDIAGLVGKRLVCASEGEFGQRLAEAKIKLLTGADRITCRALYQDFFTYVPMFKLWTVTNDLPKISGTDEAIWRRIRVIEFPVTIPKAERDPKLGPRLTAELPGILNWALDGYAEWRNGGLRPPKRVDDATSEYRRENDTIGQFIDCRCVKEANARTPTRCLYGAYSEWCDASGVRPKAVSLLGKELKRKGFEPFRAAEGNGWIGVRPLGRA